MQRCLPPGGERELQVNRNRQVVLSSGEKIAMRDSSITKVDSAHAPRGPEGERYLASGVSYVVPRGARHHYRVLEHFRAVEATSPPAQVHGRDLANGSPSSSAKTRRLAAYRNPKAVVLPPSATIYD